MSSAGKYIPNYTIEDYRHWKDDWELWDGVPVSMSPSPYGGHSKVVLNVGSELKRAIESSGCEAVTLVELDWVVSKETVLRPDLVVVCGKTPDRHLESRPDIVVEVLSESTRQRDLTYKRQMYQRQNVPYYLIVDPEENVLISLQLTSDEYTEMDIGEALELTICDGCHLETRVASFFS